MIYLDHNATTPLCPEAREAMLPWLHDLTGNPSSIHSQGRRSRAMVDESRERIAALLKAKPHEIIFTSGGTESCNLALLGLARRHRTSLKAVLLTAASEHHAVLHTMRSLANREGFGLVELPVDAKGMIAADSLLAAMCSETLLASVMIANNETGVIQNVAELATLARERGVLFHTDAIQAFGKIPCQPRDLGVDALSAAAHKFYGPPGAGFLWLRSGVTIDAIQHGGIHENERRPGTENVAAIAGMAAAAEVAFRELETTGKPESLRQDHLRNRLWLGINRIDPSAVLNSNGVSVLSNTLNVSFPGCDGETLLMGLDLEGICASSGSACMVGSIRSSHVLLAMGVPPDLAQATVRFSLGRTTTSDEIDATVNALQRVLARQRRK